LNKLKILLKKCNTNHFQETYQEQLKKFLDHGKFIIIIVISLAVGITVEGKNPKVVTKEVNDGIHKI